MTAMAKSIIHFFEATLAAMCEQTRLAGHTR